jgi:homoserine kinase
MNLPVKVRAFAPATVANITCGFDILGLAIDAPGDEVIAQFDETKTGAHIEEITGDQGRLPRDPLSNTASGAVQAYLEHMGEERGVNLTLLKNMPMGSGLGSSAASAVAALTATNALLGDPLKPEALLPFALEGEKIACGSKHGDNVAPSLLGGIVFIRSYDPLEVIKIPFSQSLWCVVVSPRGVEVRTEKARSVLPPTVPIDVMVRQNAYIAGLIAGFINEDNELISKSMNDEVVEPARAQLMPSFYEAKEDALKAGALGCGLSGSGPSMFALCPIQHAAERVGGAIAARWDILGIKSDIFISKINTRGAYCKSLSHSL